MALAPLALRTSLTRFVDLGASGFSADWQAAWTVAAERLELDRGDVPIAFDRSVEMLYEGQAYSIYVQLGRTQSAHEPVSSDCLGDMFAEAYRQHYNRAVAGGRPVISAFHLSAVLREEQVLAPVDVDADLAACKPAATSGEREVLIDGEPERTNVIAWPAPRDRWRVEGPAIVEGAYTAAVVPQGWFAAAVGDGDLVLQRVTAGAPG
jgi:N-methylhydantoinase A/oxoprolinase/acetone carboxylase beta subunit